MHSSEELRSSSFRITLGGSPRRRGRRAPGLSRPRDRIGIVVRRPCGAVGASALIMAAITAFYDVQRSASEDFFIYPDYFVLPRRPPPGEPQPSGHLAAAQGGRRRRRARGAPPGDQRPRDHPPRRRGHGRATARSPARRWRARSARIVSAIAYDANGRTRDADVADRGQRRQNLRRRRARAVARRRAGRARPHRRRAARAASRTGGRSRATAASGSTRRFGLLRPGSRSCRLVAV